MFFTKYPHPANFAWTSAWDEHGRGSAGDHPFEVEVSHFADGVSRLRIRDGGAWDADRNIIALTPPGPGEGCLRLTEAGLAICDEEGKAILRAASEGFFGACGEAHLFQWQVPDDATYYGLGGKWFKRLELSGIRSKIYNTDVWSDFHFAQWNEHEVDPAYFGTPYVAVRTRQGYVGFLLHNPGVTTIQTPGHDRGRVFVNWQRTWPHLLIGAENGSPDLWVIAAPTLAELTRRLQRLVGVTPRPPLWSLGFHQSRWGYGGEADLLKLSHRFERERLPCSALWLDLDYMREYRIFTVDENQFPHGVAHVADQLAEHGRRIVPIIDPGVKREAGYDVYESGMAAGIFCQNPIGRPYVGLVWPGETVFPDFTLEEGRRWFRDYVRDFRALGFGAAWVDMNDPSTGPVDPSDMLFQYGREPHARHRNQYALGMQMATHEGFLAAAPAERPFLLSRSGTTGSSRYSAIWYGDNISNDAHLAMSVPLALNMSLSGHAFHGPDIGGFGGGASGEMMARWVEANFLFPFFRNHTTENSPLEEPWRFSGAAKRAIYHFIRLRYQLLPYLYQLFIAQETAGDAVVRPLLYDFEDDAVAFTHDSFMVGPNLLHAPVLAEKGVAREVHLPGDQAWWSWQNGNWLAPGRFKVRCPLTHTPLFQRAGSIVPLLTEAPTSQRFDMSQVALLVALPDGESTAQGEYVLDDGLSFGYREGQESRLTIHVDADDERVSIKMAQTQDGFGPIRAEIWCTRTGVFTINGQIVPAEPHRVKLAGGKVTVYRVKL